MKIKYYLSNCFLLLLPLLLWNLIFFNDLPKAYYSETFQKDIPDWISYSENILRILVFGLPTIMIFSLKTRSQKIGFGIYLIGTLIYFLSWIAMICYPQSAWATSQIGFMAPAYTTIIWFVGIGLIGTQSYFRIPKLSLIYILLAVLFVIFHTLHIYLVFQNIQ